MGQQRRVEITCTRYAPNEREQMLTPNEITRLDWLKSGTAKAHGQLESWIVPRHVLEGFDWVIQKFTNPAHYCDLIVKECHVIGHFSKLWSSVAL